VAGLFEKANKRYASTFALQPYQGDVITGIHGVTDEMLEAIEVARDRNFFVASLSSSARTTGVPGCYFIPASMPIPILHGLYFSIR
jgi:hypothetical protein